MQSIPAVYAMKDGVVVDGFIGAYPEHVVKEFVDSLLPTEEQTEVAKLVAAGDEDSLRLALGLEPGERGRDRRPRRAARRPGPAPRKRWRCSAGSPRPTDPPGRCPRPDRHRTADDDYDEQLDALLDQVKADDEARQEFVDILELMGPDDPRTADYRRQLTARLY